MQEKQAEQAKAKIRVELPDGTITEYESNALAVVATAEGGTNAMVYSSAPIRESIKLINGLNNIKKKVLNSNPLLMILGEKLAEQLNDHSTETQANADEDTTGGGG